MAALLRFAPVQGTSMAAMARLHHAVVTTLLRAVQRRAALVRCWALHAAWRPAFRSDVTLRDSSIPPD